MAMVGRSLLLLLLLVTLAAGHGVVVVVAFDPNPLQDFCVADPTSKVRVNGLPCKDPAAVTADDFFFSGVGEPAVRVHGAVGGHPGAEHAGRVGRPRRRGPRRRFPAALPPEGVGDGGGARRRRLLRLRHVVPGQPRRGQGAPARRRVRRAAGPRPLPPQQRQRAGGAVRVAEQPEPRPGARRRRPPRRAAPRRPRRQDAPHRRGHRRQDQGKLHRPPLLILDNKSFN
ncbi:Os05g0197200 [Oryza sativa Japonica Group]|uniref:Os05g0197200 protein n=1 Tax=Oryza sativa subsp. japonica TaxID=39947 RepID=A0A0P0WJ89_ORYSJ|nr:Os05g0197200 [Oryza sativa Japonica Group]